MPDSPSSSAPALTTPERLMRLVPAQIGAWKRHMLRGAKAGPDGHVEPMIEAEFRRGNARASLSVSEAGAPPPAAASVDRKSDEGSEKTYAEGDATVRETVRRIDNRTDVALMRADGVVVLVHAIGVPAAELKALALGVKPAAAP